MTDQATVSIALSLDPALTGHAAVQEALARGRDAVGPGARYYTFRADAREQRLVSGGRISWEVDVDATLTDEEQEPTDV